MLKKIVALFFVSLRLIAFEPTLESKKIFAFEVGYVGLWRSPLKNMAFLTGVDDDPIFHKINLNYVSGMRALLEFNIGPKNSIDAIYTGLFHWMNHNETTSSSDSLNVSTYPYYSTDWSDFYFFDYHYTSTLNSGELSYWMHVTPRYIDYFSFSWMLGLRYINFRDAINMKNGTGTRGNDAHVKAANQMVGGQGGLELQCNPSNWFTWALQVKGGVYADFASRTTVFYDLGNTELLVNSKQSRVKCASSLELIPYIMCRFNPFYFKLAYDRVILFNPVFAPLQIKSTKSVDSIYTHNYVNFQAAYASIGFYW